MLRLFVAVKLSAATVARIAQIIDCLKRIPADIKWVEPHNLHITLKFLGNVERDGTGSTISALENACERTSPFDLSVSGTGCFPGRANPRVFWVGINAGSDELSELARKTDGFLREAGYEPEKKKFRPHITIGRVRRPRGVPEAVSVLRRHQDRVFGDTHVSGLELVSSSLTALGPVYTTLESIPFCSGAQTNGGGSN